MTTKVAVVHKWLSERYIVSMTLTLKIFYCYINKIKCYSYQGYVGAVGTITVDTCNLMLT